MIVIGDIHGRKFWEDAVNGHENELIVFLGDYHDPYPYEDDMITHKESIQNFKNIIEFKKKHKNNVILLLGNHDLHYFYYSIRSGRYDIVNAKILHSLFVENLELFQLTYYHECENKNILFSHAGITKAWLRELQMNNLEEKELSRCLNYLFDNKDKLLLKHLCDISYYRLGTNNCGSIVWADINEHIYNTDRLEVYQIFGHTQQVEYPIISDYFACLDCRRPFIVTPKGEIQEYG